MNFKEIVKRLELPLLAFPDESDWDANKVKTVLFYAVRIRKDWEIAERLLELFPQYKQHALQYSISGRLLKGAEIAISAGAKIMQLPGNEIYSCFYKYLQDGMFMRFLLENGLDPDFRKHANGENVVSPLLAAFSVRNANAAKLLLEFGADPRIKGGDIPVKSVLDVYLNKCGASTYLEAADKLLNDTLVKKCLITVYFSEIDTSHIPEVLLRWPRG